MTEADHKQTMEMAELAVNRYFDHYLSEVFPKQMDLYLNAHINACPTGKKVARLGWMIAGATALVSVCVTVGTILYYYVNVKPVLHP
jgi:hypothetical protein